MKQTTNYSLNKIELEDSPPDITVLNPNFDKIDTELKRLTDKDAELDGVIDQVKTDYLPKTGGNITDNLTVKSKYVARSVNGEVADANGNIIIDVKGDVRSVNGIRPDEAGNVEIKAGVVSVNDVKPDPDTGDIDLGDRIKDASSRTDILEAVTQAGFNAKALAADVAVIKNNYVRTVNGAEADASGAVSVTTVSGNAGTATKLATARTISLTGDVTGSTTFDGSGNKSIATTTKTNPTFKWTVGGDTYGVQMRQSGSTGEQALSLVTYTDSTFATTKKFNSLIDGNGVFLPEQGTDIALSGTTLSLKNSNADVISSVTLSEATQSANGLMSASDKKKLDGITEGANKYTLPTASSSTLGGVKIGSNISVTSGTISLSKSNVTNALGYTPTQHSSGTTDLTAGSSTLETNTLYFVYE